MIRTTFAAMALLAVTSMQAVADDMPPANNKFVVNTSQSGLVWKAEKVTGKHEGTVALSGGEISMANGVLKSGSFTIDMSSMLVTDIKDAGMNSKLLGHLKSDDFFSVDKHKTARFDITSVTAGSQAGSFTVKGNLTIKGITKPIEFPAAIVVDGKTLKATGTAVVDRTKFDIRYGSKSFFESIGDKAIYDDFNIELQIVATMK